MPIVYDLNSLSGAGARLVQKVDTWYYPILNQLVKDYFAALCTKICTNQPAFRGLCSH